MAMRRFEFVEGTSAKFWMADAEGANFVVVYGRLGTAGQRKEKAFPDAKGAQKELEKKIAEKLREGYYEVAADAAASAPAGAKGAAAASKKLELPPRVAARTPTEADMKAARDALAQLRGLVGGRSWQVSHAAKRARRALLRLGGFDPARDAALATEWDALVASVTAKDKSARLPMRLALMLLTTLDTAAFEKALAAWRAAPPSPAQALVNLMGAEADSLGEPELALRIGALLGEHPSRNGSTDAAWDKRWKKVSPHLEAFLISKGSRLRDHLKGLSSGGDAHLGRRLSRVVT